MVHTNWLYITIIALLSYIVYLYFYIDYSELTNIILPDEVLEPVETLTNPRNIIWSYWHDSKKPISVKLAISSWIKYNPNMQICGLSKKTLRRYIDTETFPDGWENKSHQLQSDIIRVALLEKYGGFWLDSTIFLSKSLSNWYNQDMDIGGFCADYFTTDKSKPIIESSFLFVPEKHSKIMKEWKKEFFYALSTKNLKQYIDDLDKTVDLQNLKSKEYLIVFCCFMKVIDKQEYNIKVIPATEGLYSYLIKNNWWSYNAVLYLLTNESDDLQPVYKLRNSERFYLNYLISSITKKSILGRILKY